MAKKVKPKPSTLISEKCMKKTYKRYTISFRKIGRRRDDIPRTRFVPLENRKNDDDLEIINYIDTRVDAGENVTDIVREGLILLMEKEPLESE